MKQFDPFQEWTDGYVRYIYSGEKHFNFMNLMCDMKLLVVTHNFSLFLLSSNKSLHATLSASISIWLKDLGFQLI